MNITRVKPPKFKVGRYTLNEYELRTLMIEVAEGKKNAGIRVKDSNGNVGTILSSGFLDYNLKGFGMCSKLAMKILYLKNNPHNESR